MKMMSEVIAEKQVQDQQVQPPVEQEQKPVEQQEPQEQINTQQSEHEQDIISKVLSPKKTTDTNNTAKPTEQKPVDDDIKFDVNDIDKIQDPVAKEYAQKAYKSFERGYQKKFQDLAQEKRELETQREASNTWTPERVQQLLSNEEFIKASQQIIQSTKPDNVDMSQEDWSNLSDSDKLKIQGLQNRIDKMEQDKRIEKYQAQLDKENSELTAKYVNYDASKINQIRRDMFDGKIQATNEHLYKAFYHDENVRRAYQDGLADGRNGVKEKADASAVQVTNTQAIPATGQIQRKEGESSESFLQRIMMHHMNNKPKK